MFGIQIISAKMRMFRIWNFRECKSDISVWQIFRNVQYRWELNN